MYCKHYQRLFCGHVCLWICTVVASSKGHHTCTSLCLLYHTMIISSCDHSATSSIKTWQVLFKDWGILRNKKIEYSIFFWGNLKYIFFIDITNISWVQCKCVSLTWHAWLYGTSEPKESQEFLSPLLPEISIICAIFFDFYKIKNLMVPSERAPQELSNELSCQ
jgi:hypothetical protein